MKNLVKIIEASHLTPYTPEYISLRVRQGAIKGRKIGRIWFVTLSSLRIYLVQQLQKTTIKKIKLERSLIKLQNKNEPLPTQQQNNLH